MDRSKRCQTVNLPVRWESATAVQNLRDVNSRKLWSVSRSDCASKKNWKSVPRQVPACSE